MSNNPFDSTDFWSVWRTAIGTQYLSSLDDRLRNDHEKLLKRISTEFGRQGLRVFACRGFDEPCQKYGKAHHRRAKILLDATLVAWEPEEAPEVVPEESPDEPPLMAKLRQIVYVNSLVTASRLESPPDMEPPSRVELPSNVGRVESFNP